MLDGDGSAYCAGGLVLDCPARTVPELVEWVLEASGLGAPRLHRHGQDADPLVVLTASAAERLGLPARLEDRRGLRLPQDHPVVGQIAAAGWQLTRRGFGPWTRIYRTADGSRRRCVQLAVLPWDALDPRSWGAAAALPPADLARVLCVYARRVITPRGSTAVNGLELMTSLRPPTRPVRNETTGAYTRGHNPGSLGLDPIDPAPPEAPPEHPVAQGWAEGFLEEEAYQWARDPELLTDEECLLPWAVGLDLNTAFLAAAARLPVGLGEPEEVLRPAFDKKVPGTWLVDLSHIELDPRLPSPFTPDGTRPDGPGWYATPTVAYAVELGHDVRPVKAFLRPRAGAYLDPWHDRLKDAYLATLADIGVTTDLDEPGFLAAMARHQLLKGTDPADLGAVRGLAAGRAALTGPDALRDAIRDNQARATGLLLADPRDLHDLAAMDDSALTRTLNRHRMVEMVLTAIKSTVKGGVGKLRERPQGRHYRPGEPWPALNRPAWRPDIRAAIIAKARVNMHRKLANMARTTGRYPLGVLSDCVVYPAAGPGPLDLLPRGADGRTVPGVLRPGPGPGGAKLEGTQEMAWAVDLLEQGFNPARHIKGDGHDATLDEGE
nr:transcriptional regulator [Streptomyces pactum]